MNLRAILLLPCLWIVLSLNAQSYTVEAEDGILSGPIVETIYTGFNGTGYVGPFSDTSHYITMTVEVVSSGVYNLGIRYNQPWSVKDEDVRVNGFYHGTYTFPPTNGFDTLDAGNVLLHAGENTITIDANWTWIYIDNIVITKVIISPIDYGQADELLIDPLATSETVSLFNRLVDNYGEKVISGQFDNFAGLESISINRPVIRGWDVGNYTNGYPYSWDNGTGTHAFGWRDYGATEEIIDWYHQEGGCGMVTIQWHWHAPDGIGSVPGLNNFMSENTTFDISQAVVPSHPDHQYLLEDIDSIATQLQRLQEEGIPVLWRPLHEASGTWFWWGAHEAQPCLDLYDLMYDRLTNYHGLHNLIWVWSGAPELDWYPGNEKVDIYGLDSYPDAFDYGSQKFEFEEFYDICGGEKIIAMTENGPIPDPDELIAQDAIWSYFMTWDGMVTSDNEAEHITSVYSNANVLTLGNSGCSATVGTTTNDDFISFDVYPNPSVGAFTIRVPTDMTIQISLMKGPVIATFVVEDTKSMSLASGVYLITAIGFDKTTTKKLIISD